MKDYIKYHPWKIIEEGFDQEYNEVTESLLSIGNGHFGLRGNFEEGYSGKTLQGSYIGGVYYPDKTRVGWWKNGYPEYFAKVLNSVNWIGLRILIDGEKLDLAVHNSEGFQRHLNMKEGVLYRTFSIQTGTGKSVEFSFERFCSFSDNKIGALRCKVKAVNQSVKLSLSSFLDFDVVNKDSNYDEKFWDQVSLYSNDHVLVNVARTRKTEFDAGAASHTTYSMAGQTIKPKQNIGTAAKYIEISSEISLNEGQELVIDKLVCIDSSRNMDKSLISAKLESGAKQAAVKGYKSLKSDHLKAWANQWEKSDVEITGDIPAQQAIRFNIFQLYATYTGQDERLNIGPKGFTGEKYGGSTYWDTEAYCLPFYLFTNDTKIAKNLLIYRYNHLQKAIENASLLGFSDGAALYPMVTMNGEECHNEWEITFEEIHRNGAIAYAIYQYLEVSQDPTHLMKYGLEVLIGIARFWSQRFTFSQKKQQYVLLGVTGPNEYENNVNNNWHTMKMGIWCMKYTILAIEECEKDHFISYQALESKLQFQKDQEIQQWKKIISNTYLPYDEERGVYLQQDGFLDKELLPVADLDPIHLPINQHWSWDRVLRSCYIKQADVLQYIYFFLDDFSIEEVKNNFEFYEPLTVHESSLSPCIHSILASYLGMEEKAYELYLRTARLDLNDYNNDTEDGLHITSMAGTWLSIVQGFAGMRLKNDLLTFNAFLPNKWTAYSFNINFRKRILAVEVSKDGTKITRLKGEPIRVINQNEILEI